MIPFYNPPTNLNTRVCNMQIIDMIGFNFSLFLVSPLMKQNLDRWHSSSHEQRREILRFLCIQFNLHPWTSVRLFLPKILECETYFSLVLIFLLFDSDFFPLLSVNSEMHRPLIFFVILFDTLWEEFKICWHLTSWWQAAGLLREIECNF